MDRKTKKSNRLGKVISIMDLNWKCNDEKEPLREKYIQLAIASSQNLGGPSSSNLNQAIDWLKINAGETTEEGVVDEINFCIPLVK